MANIKKIHYTWKDIEHQIQVINNLMFADNWRPSYIVGLTRGGLVPATIMSNMTGITMHALDVRFRDMSKDYIGPESNERMKQDAHDGKNILIIDDINDSGKTLDWIKKDWGLRTLGMLTDTDNVRTACLIDNVASDFDVDYTALEINKVEDPVWLVFPWECERNYGNI